MIFPDEIIDADDFAGLIVMFAGAVAPSGWLLCQGQAVSRTTYSLLFSLIGTNYGAGDGSTTFNVPDLRGSFPLGAGQKIKTFTFTDSDVDVANNLITITSNDFIKTGTPITLTTTGTLPSGLATSTTYYAVKISSTTIKLATSLDNAIGDSPNKSSVAVSPTVIDITSASGGGTHTISVTLTNRTLGLDGGEEEHLLTIDEMPFHRHQQSSDNGNTGSWGGNPSDNYKEEQFQYRTSGAGGSDRHNNMPPFLVMNFIIKT